MHTLTKSEYDTVRATFRQYIESRQEGAAWHHLLYLLLIEQKTEKILKAFPRVHSARSLAKLAGQALKPDHKLWKAIGEVKYQLANLKQARAFKAAGRKPYADHEYSGIKLYYTDYTLPISDEAIARTLERLERLCEVAKG